MADAGDRLMSQPGEAVVRPIAAGDIAEILDLLQENWPRISPAEWRALFDHSWDGDDPDLGFVLVGDGAIQGYLGTIYSTRSIEGRSHRLCNITSWYVREPYRGSSLRLFMAMLRQASVVTVQTPSKSTQPVLQASGFRSLDSARHLYFPLLHIETLFRGFSLKVKSGAGEIEPHLDAGDRKIMADLAGTGCGQFYLGDGEGYCYLVTKKRQQRFAGVRLAVSDVLYCSDRKLLCRHLERFVLAVLGRERTVAMIGDERILGKKSRRGVRIPFDKYFRSSTLEARQIDNLYSELVLLPI